MLFASRRPLICAALGLAAASVWGVDDAAAEDLTGRYSVKGSLANGSQYSVRADIKMTSETTCDIHWSDGSEGICILEGKSLSIGSDVQGKPQVGIYHLNPDGSLEGIFTDNFHPKGISREKLTPIK